MNKPGFQSRRMVIVAGLFLFLAGCSIGATRFTLPDPDPITPNDTLFAEQWNLRTIRMPEAWGLLHDPLVERIVNNRQGIAPVVVAVLDTQIDVDHPDLSANVLGEVYRAPSLGAPIAGSFPDRHHGTHVAGIIAAETGNGTGIAGIGFDRIRVLPVTVLKENGVGSAVTVLEGMLYAAGMNEDLPPHTANVINMSLGGPGALGDDFESALVDMLDAGIVVVAAAGNENPPVSGAGVPVDYPARYPSVIAVGSANGSDLSSFTFAPYTAFGPEIDLVAPGGSGVSGDTYGRILSTQIVTGDTFFLELPGTSQAAPHVAGVAALMRAVNQELTPQEIAHILRETASPAPVATDPDRYGAGMLNAHAALAAALSAPYGPFARNDFSVSPLALEPEDPDHLGLRMSARGGEPEAGRSAQRFASEGPTGTELPRIIITLDRAWFRSTDHADVEAALHDIALRHGLGPMRFLGNRFPSFAISDQQTGSAELLLDLVGEAVVHDAIYDTPVSLTGIGGTTGR